MGIWGSSSRLQGCPYHPHIQVQRWSTSCDNHRGISLLSVAGKIFGRIIVNRLSFHVFCQDVIPESQCGFCSGRGTADMIFTARQIQEKCREQQVDLYMIFIDLTKAFDTVHRNGLWKGLKQISCTDKFIRIIRAFHEDKMAQVLDSCILSDQFYVCNGTKQGCFLAPLLFSIYFAMMLLVAFQKCNIDVPIQILSLIHISEPTRPY